MSRLGAQLLLVCCFVTAALDGAASNSAYASLRGKHSYAGAVGDLILAAEDSSAVGSRARAGKEFGAVARTALNTSATTADHVKPLDPAAMAPQSSAAIAPAADMPAVLASSAENPPGRAEAAVGAPTTPGQAPSLIQRLEGREGDLTVWVVIAVIFFLFGWLGGSVYSRRRERSRRGRLRF